MKKSTILSAVVAIAPFGLGSCCFFNPAACCKVTPPPLSDSRTTDVSAKAAADTLSSSIAKGSIEGNVKQTVDQTFAQVDDAMALYLLLQAANCESARGNESSAAHLRESARLELLARRDQDKPRAVKKVGETPATLTPVEERILENSPIKEEIKKELPATSATPPVSAGATGGA